jgi:DNA primase
MTFDARDPRETRGLGAAPARAGGDDWVERVRSASDIIEIVGQTVPLRRVGRNWMGRCPFHEEKTPSFSVNGERQFYHCFSCKVGGDVFKFIQETEKVGFLEAVELLSRRAGIPVPERRGAERGKRAPLLEALEAATTAYEQWLGDPDAGAAARAYLERRGITRETQRAFRLGLALPGWDHLVPRLVGRFGEDVLIEARLAGRKDGSRSIYDWFRNRLMVPLVAPGGAVLGFGARAFGDEQPKYLNSSESSVYHKSQFLFALEQARKVVQADGEMVVVEGYFDAIAMHQAGIRNTVATSGTALTAEHAHTLRRLARGVALTYDGDAAGQQAMLRSLGVLFAEGLDVVIVDLPRGEDPDSLVRGAGADGWARLRDSAYDAVEFVHRHVLRTASGGDPRERALQILVRLLTGVSDPIRHRLLVERASRVFGLSEAVIARAARLASGGDKSGRPVTAAVHAQRRVGNELERRLLRGLLHAPELLESARAELGAEDLEDAGARALAKLWWEQGVVMPGEDAPDGVASLARELATEASQAEEGQDERAEVLGAIRRLVMRRLQRDRRAREAQLVTARGEESTRLMREIQEIASTLKKLST